MDDHNRIINIQEARVLIQKAENLILCSINGTSAEHEEYGQHGIDRLLNYKNDFNTGLNELEKHFEKSTVDFDIPHQNEYTVELTTIRKSIDHKWIPIKDGLQLDNGTHDCPLYKTFRNPLLFSVCIDCPLSKCGNKYNCSISGSVYDLFYTYSANLIKNYKIDNLSTKRILDYAKKRSRICETGTEYD